MTHAKRFGWQYSDFHVRKVDPALMQSVSFPTRGGLTLHSALLTNEPGATFGVEQFLPEHGWDWQFYFDEVHYVLSGGAQIEYCLAPMFETWQSAEATAGCAYLIPKGAHLKFKVLGSEPYVHLWVVMPGGMLGDDLPPSLAKLAAAPEIR